MVEILQTALEERGIEDTIRCAGQFSPRGRSGSAFAGGLVGGEIGGLGGHVGEAVGFGAGLIAGPAANAAAAGLPENLLVGASDTTVYGFASRSRRHVPDELVFRVERAGLVVKVHARVNVRVLELIHTDTGSAIELEGNRLPITHSKDVIEFLSESPGGSRVP
jgi:hypothetical protein